MKNLKRNLSLLLLAVACNNCSTLGSKEVFVACQTLDIATTVRALHLSKTAYETNTIPLPILFLFKIALMFYIWNAEPWNKPQPPEINAMKVAVNVISCTPIPRNLKAAKGN